jgi:hypothetical protein
MFRATAVFEKMFLESKERVEIVIAPLAVYREFNHPEVGESSPETGV